MNKDDERYQELPRMGKIHSGLSGKENMYRISKPFEAGVLFGTSFERITVF